MLDFQRFKPLRYASDALFSIRERASFTDLVFVLIDDHTEEFTFADIDAKVMMVLHGGYYCG